MGRRLSRRKWPRGAECARFTVTFLGGRRQSARAGQKRALRGGKGSIAAQVLEGELTGKQYFRRGFGSPRVVVSTCCSICSMELRTSLISIADLGHG